MASIYSINVLPVLLISSGLLIIGVLFYLKFRLSRYVKFLIRLIGYEAKNQPSIHELTEFLSEHGSRVGIEDIYLAAEVNGKKVESGKNLSLPFIQVREKGETFDVVLKLFVKKKPKGEMKYVNLIVAKFLLLVFTVKVLAEESIKLKSLENLNRMRTFIVHDAKNLAQFIENLTANLELLESKDDKARFVDMLKNSSSLLKLRAIRILTSLGISPRVRWSKNVCPFLEELLKFYRLGCRFECNANAKLNHAAAVAVEAVLRNLHEKSLKEKFECSVVVNEENGRVTVTVSDTGSPPENPLEVFEPFYTTKKGGLGLGLYHAKRLIEWEGGKLYLRTGRKTSFTVEFPAE